MRIIITAPDAPTRDEALILIKRQQFAGTAPVNWTLTLREDDVSALLETDSNIHPIDLPPGVAVADVPPPVPAQIALWQAKAALQGAGLLDRANAAIAAADNPVLSLFWQTATTIDRTSSTLAQVSARLGMTGEQVDQLFIEASMIVL
jgi:hypothetical protein